MTDSHGESKQKAQTIFYLDSTFFNSFSYRRRVTRVDKSWKIRRKILSLPFRKTKFVLIQSQNGNLSIATREEETRFRFKFETTVRYAETIRSDLKTDSDTHTHIRGRIKQRNLLYSGRGCGTWPRNSKPFLECVRSYTTFHLSLLRPSRKKKKKEKTNFPSIHDRSFPPVSRRKS